jgi:hypothetical protein
MDGVKEATTGMRFASMTYTSTALWLGITASRGKRKSNGTYTLQDEYDESATKLKKLVRKHHLLTPWKVERLKWFREIYKTEYEWWDCFNNFPRQVMVDKVRGEAERLISECGMSPDDAEKLACHWPFNVRDMIFGILMWDGMDASESWA